MRYTPFESIDRMMDQLRHDMYDIQTNLSEGFPALEEFRHGTALDLAEHDDAYVLTVDLPGFETDEIELRYDEGQLWLSAEHETGEEAEDSVRTRRRSFSERVTIPREVDAEAISAIYHNGVLEVHLPVPADAPERGFRIDIE